MGHFVKGLLFIFFFASCLNSSKQNIQSINRSSSGNSQNNSFFISPEFSMLKVADGPSDGNQPYPLIMKLAGRCSHFDSRSLQFLFSDTSQSLAKPIYFNIDGQNNIQGYDSTVLTKDRQLYDYTYVSGLGFLSNNEISSFDSYIDCENRGRFELYIHNIDISLQYLANKCSHNRESFLYVNGMTSQGIVQNKYEIEIDDKLCEKFYPCSENFSSESDIPYDYKNDASTILNLNELYEFVVSDTLGSSSMSSRSPVIACNDEQLFERLNDQILDFNNSQNIFSATDDFQSNISFTNGNNYQWGHNARRLNQRSYLYILDNINTYTEFRKPIGYKEINSLPGDTVSFNELLNVCDNAYSGSGSCPFAYSLANKNYLSLGVFLDGKINGLGHEIANQTIVSAVHIDKYYNSGPLLMFGSGIFYGFLPSLAPGYDTVIENLNVQNNHIKFDVDISADQPLDHYSNNILYNAPYGYKEYFPSVVSAFIFYDYDGNQLPSIPSIQMNNIQIKNNVIDGFQPTAGLYSPSLFGPVFTSDNHSYNVTVKIKPSNMIDENNIFYDGNDIDYDISDLFRSYP
ncbi:MAG: hypothetical protein H6621_07240 [Halobacteriovoraceae bacterium]|nr:hypothetical protein [Halobacteriovoraceae bacterium]